MDLQANKLEEQALPKYTLSEEEEKKGYARIYLDKVRFYKKSERVFPICQQGEKEGTVINTVYGLLSVDGHLFSARCIHPFF